MPYVPYVADKSGERVSEQVRVLVTPTMERMIRLAAEATYTSYSAVLRMCVEYTLGDPSEQTISVIEALHDALQTKSKEDEHADENPLVR